MARTRFYNARILTFDPASSNEIVDGEVHIDGSKIEWVGTSLEAKEHLLADKVPPFDTLVDCHGDILMPTFKDAHTHSAMVLIRGMAEGKPLGNWLNEDVFPIEAKLNEEDVYWGTRLAILEYLRGGIGMLFDMYLKERSAIDATIDSCLRGAFVSGINSYDCDDRDPYKRIHDEFTQWNRLSPLVRYFVGFHAEYTTKSEHISEICAAARDLKSPAFVHISETKSEVDGCVSRYGKTPLEYLANCGFFVNGGGVFHGVWLTESEMTMAHKLGVGVCTCPGSNAKLASGTARILALKNSGVNLALGTDGAASNNRLNMFWEMALLVAKQRLATGDASAINTRDVLTWACSGGADFMHSSEVNSIRKGAEADIIRLDRNHPALAILEGGSLCDAIVFSGDASMVKTTYVGGKVLYNMGEYFVGESAEKIINKALSSKKRLYSLV